MKSFPVIDPVLNPISPEARAVSDAFVTTLMVCAVIFGIVVVLIAWCALRYRRRDGAPDPVVKPGGGRLEMSWTLASILVLVFLFVLTVHAMRVSDPPMNRKPDVTVIGHQWWWEARYSNGVVAANEIHIPVKSDVLVLLESADVIHSFWAPQLGPKIDAVPGHPNHLWIRADEPGLFEGACTVFCGAQHAWMRVRVVAQLPGDFDEWSAQQALPARTANNPDATPGQRVFVQRTCAQCHFIRGVNADVRIGPDLTHFGSRQTIGTGVLANNSAALRRWLENPQDVKPGCFMPDFHLSNAELAGLTAYLQSLK